MDQFIGHNFKDIEGLSLTSDNLVSVTYKEQKTSKDNYSISIVISSYITWGARQDLFSHIYNHRSIQKTGSLS